MSKQDIKNSDVLNELQDIEIKGKKFKFANVRCMLTYKTHINKTDIETFITSMAPCKFIRSAHENGTNDPITPYEHTHVLIKFESKFTTENCRKFDIKGLHPNIKKITTNTHWNNCLSYMGKEDPDNADLKPETSEVILNNLGSCGTVKEALLKNMTLDDQGRMSWSQVTGIKEAYKIMKPDNEEIQYEEPTFPWQLDLLHEIDNTPVSNRKLIWYYDKQGRSGKTQLSRYLMATRENEWFCTKDMGTSRDCATIIAGALESGWKSKGLILDLPRSSEEHGRIYTYLETILDGHVTATKYEGTNKLFNPPRTIVFANYLPKIYNDCGNPTLSLDRWDIREITTDKTVNYLDTDSNIIERQDIKSKTTKVDGLLNTIGNLTEEELAELKNKLNW